MFNIIFCWWLDLNHGPWNRKWLLYQLSHNYCPLISVFLATFKVVWHKVRSDYLPPTPKVLQKPIGCTRYTSAVWPDWAIYRNLGNFSKPLATINLPKSTFLGNFCKGVKIFNFSSEIIFGQLLKTFGNFLLVTLYIRHSGTNGGCHFRN